MELKYVYGSGNSTNIFLLIAPLMELKYNAIKALKSLYSTFNRTAYGIEITLRH